MKEVIFDKAKKHKKWLEKCDITTYSYEINSTDYYFAFYTRKNDVTGYAIVSDKEERRIDIEKAFRKLQTFASVSSNLFGSLGELARISPDYFFDIANAVPSNTTDDILLRGKRVFEEIGELQSKLVDEYKKYEQYYDSNVGKSLKMTDKEIDDLVETASVSDILQFKQSRLLIDEYSNLKEFSRKLKKTDGMKKLAIDRETFLKTLLSTDPSKQENIMEQIRYVERGISSSLSVDRQLEDLIRYSNEDREIKQNDYLKKIRYPKV